MQRLFSTFPVGVPGAGLLVLRGAAGLPLLYAGLVTSASPSPAIAPLVTRGAAVRLLIGLWTPLAGLLIAVAVLREAFGYAYRDIAKVLRLAEANSRQIVTRARQHVASGRATATSAVEQERLLAAFIAAAQEGDVAGLERLFASAVFSTSGESVRAA